MKFTRQEVEAMVAEIKGKLKGWTLPDEIRGSNDRRNSVLIGVLWTLESNLEHGCEPFDYPADLPEYVRGEKEVTP